MNRKTKNLAMVLAGGRVDELNVLTYYRPKSAVPFGGFARVIDFTLSNLLHSGLEQVAILSQFRSYSLINHIDSGAAWDMLGRYRGISILPPSTSSENSSWYRGSADSVYQNLDFVRHHDPEVVFILSGDHIYNMNYQKMIDYHRDKDADLTIACLQVPAAQAQRFGVAQIDDEDGRTGGRVLAYAEKPQNSEFNWASMTIFCFKPQILYAALAANAHEDNSFEFGRDIIPRLMAGAGRIYGYKFYDYWGYSRTIEEYWQSNMDLLGENPAIDLEAWGLRTNLEHRGIRDCAPLKIGRAATVSDSLIYNGCVVDGLVERSILYPGVRVEKGAVVRDSILFFNNKVAADARLEKVISDVNSTIGSGCQLGGCGDLAAKEITVLGWNNHLPAGTVIGGGCTIYPGQDSSEFDRVIGDGEVIR
ncbi:MAG: glucose-1-phosphate adenylyltransferase [Deltaproteobacteria bacterium]|nr:glucose-1-phosphate adenylyltransferase [Deltaproteobacteria bacterium]